MTNYLHCILRLGQQEPIAVDGVQEDSKTTDDGVFLKIRINEGNFEWIPIQDAFSSIVERDCEINRIKMSMEEELLEEVDNRWEDEE